MKTISATKVRQGFNEVMTRVKDEPVRVSKRDKNIAVILSNTRYEELKRLEDILYGKAAELAIAEGFASDKDTEDLINSI